MMEGGELAPGQKESVGSGTDPESRRDIKRFAGRRRGEPGRVVGRGSVGPGG